MVIVGYTQLYNIYVKLYKVTRSYTWLDYTWLHMVMVVKHGLFMVIHGYSRLYIVIL